MSGAIPMISPGVRVNEIDQSSYTAIPGLPSNAFGIVGAARFGPINIPVLLTSVSQFESIFSVPVDLAGLTAVNTLAAGGTVYYCRFANGSEANREATITGTGGNLKLTPRYKGTINSGVWTATVTTDEDDDKAFTLEISRVVTPGSEPIIMSPATELSLDPDAVNYYKTWDNFYFTLSAPTDPTAITAGDYEFSAGNDGVNIDLSANATAVSTALDVFSDRETYELMYLTAPMYSTIGSVALKLVSISNSRKDLVAQIDHNPNPEEETAQEIVDELKPYTGTNNSYVALWAGIGGYIVDPYNNNAEVTAPPSAYIIPALASLYAVRPVWTPPASVSYLPLTQLARLDVVWTQADRDLLYKHNINPILNYKGLGYTAMGQKTGQTRKSATDRLNVRHLVNYCKVGIEKLSVDFLFAPIDEETFTSWTYRVTNFLNAIRTERGLYDFQVKMDWETVTEDAINNNLMPGIVRIKPTKVAEFLDIDLVIKNFSDSF